MTLLELVYYMRVFGRQHALCQLLDKNGSQLQVIEDGEPVSLYVYD